MQSVSATSPDPGATIPPDESQWRVGTLAYHRRGLTRLFSWLLWGDLAWSIRDRSMGSMLQLLLKQFQASDTLAGLLSGTLPSAIGFVLGPVVSFRSDHYRSPRGRRLPFLLVSAPLAAVAILGLGFSSVLGGALHRALGERSPGLFPAVLIVLAGWWIVFDFATTITNTIFTALINDVVPHGVIGRFYGLFRAVSLLVGIVFNYWLLEKAEAHYQWMFVAVAAIYGVGVVLMCLRLREGDYPPPPPSVPGGGLARFLGASREYFVRAFSQPYYLWFYAASQLGRQAPLPVNLYTVYYVKSLDMSLGTYGKILAGTYVVSFCLSYVLGQLADRFHPLRLSIAAVALYGLTVLASALLVHGKFSFGVALLVHGVLSGCYFTASASLGQRLLPKENFAQFTSAADLVSAGITMTLPLVLGYCLDLSGHLYRLVFWAGTLMSVAALVSFAAFYRLWSANDGAPPATAADLPTAPRIP